jgi:RNA polymerase sigma-70 factor (ECF subfamily)
MHPHPIPPDDEQLVERCRQGDRQAFAQLVDRYWRPLHGWLYRMTRSRHTAEDLTQESWLKAWAALASYRPGAGFRAWLFRIARNAWIDHERRTARGARRAALPDPRPEAQPLDAMLHRERQHLLQHAISVLPDRYREVLLLRCTHGLSFAEISRVVGAPEDTVRWRAFKARRALLELLAPTFDGEDRPQ